MFLINYMPAVASIRCFLTALLTTDSVPVLLTTDIVSRLTDQIYCFLTVLLTTDIVPVLLARDNVS